MLKLEPEEEGWLRNEGYETYVVAGSGLASGLASGLSAEIPGLAATGSGLVGSLAAEAPGLAPTGSGSALAGWPEVVG